MTDFRPSRFIGDMSEKELQSELDSYRLLYHSARDGASQQGYGEMVAILQSLLARRKEIK